jgi:hypothetical protein
MNCKIVPLMEIKKQDSFHIDELLQNNYESKDTQTISSVESLYSKKNRLKIVDQSLDNSSKAYTPYIPVDRQSSIKVNNRKNVTV